MMIRFRLGVLLVAAATVPALAIAPARSATFDVAIFHTERDAFADAYKFWAAEVEKRTQGRVQFTAHYSGALTSIVETLGAVRRGVVPVGLTAASFSAGAVPALAYLEVIGGMPNEAEDARKVIDAIEPTMRTLLGQAGVEYLWMQPGFDVIVVCRDKHLKSPADWTGQKVRAAGRWQSAQVAAMGASPIAIDPAEQYLALQNKTVDCALSIPNLTQSLKLFEVAPKITRLRQPVNPSMYIMNPQSWRQIAAADQQIMREVSRATSHFAIRHLHDYMAGALRAMSATGADVYALSDAELKVTKERMQSVFGRIGEAAGEPGKTVVEHLKPYW
jgi:TRAP-type transport system periplasmic protein